MRVTRNTWNHRSIASESTSISLNDIRCTAENVLRGASQRKAESLRLQTLLASPENRRLDSEMWLDCDGDLRTGLGEIQYLELSSSLCNSSL